MKTIGVCQQFKRIYWFDKFAWVLAFVVMANAQVSGQNVDSDVPVALLPVAGEVQLTPEQAIAQQAALNDEQVAVKASVSQPDLDDQQNSIVWSGYATAESMAVNGNPEGALKQLDARLVSAPEDAKAAYIKGMILMQLGRVEDAERWFKMMQSNFPDLPQSYNALAVIYAAKNDLYAAETALRDLLAKHPEHQKARLNLVNIYLDLAEIELKNALKEAPNDAMISNTLQSLQTLRQ